MNSKYILAQDIVKKYKISYHTVNYYTAIGLLSLIRKEGNKRIYDANEVKVRLKMIMKFSKEGYPLNLIRKKIVGI
ncbi:MAG: MerR family transcriptional regulator [Candidatus Omnitrophica bacterium]|nr:MerR family transcriptional regulator [Candidatus Omnitrophota bacterium]